MLSAPELVAGKELGVWPPDSQREALKPSVMQRELKPQKALPSLTKCWRLYRLAAASTLDLEASRLKLGRLSNSGTSTRG